MMKFKKFLAAAMAGAMMLGLAATAASAVSVYADESTDEDTTTEGPKFDAFVDYENHTLNISAPDGSDDVYAFVQVWKLNSDGSFKTGGTTYSVPLDSEGSATMDLSFLKVTTAQGLKVFGDKATTPFEVIVNAQPGKLTLKYDAVNNIFTGKANGTTLPETGLEVGEDKYVYRGQYATNWLPLEDLSEINHTSAGATIVIHELSTENAPAGADVKVKIAASAKAPKVTIDYVKATISIPKGTECYVIGEDGAEFVPITEAASKAWKATLTELGAYGASDQGGVTLLIRTAATDRKAASNVAAVVIPKVQTASLSDDSTDDEGKVIVSDSTATVTYKKGGTESKPAFVFTANGASFDFSVNGGDTWKTVRDKSSYSVALTDKAQTVSVRLTGVKSDMTLPSQETTVTVPAKVTATPSPDPSPEVSTTPSQGE